MSVKYGWALVTLALTLALTLVSGKDSLSLSLLRKQGESVKKVVNGTGDDEGMGADLRQYGGSTSYGGGGGGQYDIYTLIAVSAFAALFGALFFELIAGGSFRSLDEPPTLELPFSLDVNQLTGLVSKITQFISNPSWIEGVAAAQAKSRTLRDVTGKLGVNKFFDAYKKDPIEYQCVRKAACETLAESSLVANSMKSPLGAFVLSTVGSFMNHGEELELIVRNTVENADYCKNMAPWGFCEDDDDNDDIPDSNNNIN